jgi:hypothetical protein
LAGGAGFPLTVNGSGFAMASKVKWNGAERVTTYVSTTELTAAILAGDIALAGSASVTVSNPVPGGGVSAAQTFTIYGTSPTPVWVDDSWTGPADCGGHVWGYDAFTNVQAAVTAVATGGTVNVAAGTYAGNVAINKALTLVGDPGDVSAGPGPSAPVIDGGSLPGDGFLIANGVADVTIKGFEIRNFSSPDMDGIGNGVSAWVGSTANITIQDNYFHHLGYNGVLVGNDYSANPSKWGDHSGWTIKANIIEDFGYIGFELTNTKDSSIEDNVIHMMTPYIGAIFSSARRSESGLTIKNNRIDGTPSTTYPVIYIYAYDLDMVSPTLNNVLIEGNDIASVGTPFQIYVRDIGTGRITGVQVRNNSLSTLRNRTAATVDATLNWWGTIDGATIATQIIGLVAGDVDYSPWLGDGTDTQLTVVGFQPNAAPIYYTPTGLSFSTQPGGANLGGALSPQPVVTVTNEIGGVALQYQGDVTMAIGSNLGGGTLSGTTPVAAVNGVATFSGLAIDKVGVGYTLVASATALGSRTSAAFDISNPAVSGQVELQGFVGSSRMVRFIASQVDEGTTNYLQTNDVTLSFSGGKADYSFSVPPLTTHLSAKTAWNLRKLLPVTFTGGMATVDFSGSGARLRTGDLQATGGGIEDTDNQVTLSDLDIVLGYWNKVVGLVPAADRADINGDALVDLNDLDLVLGNWLASGDAE